MKQSRAALALSLAIFPSLGFAQQVARSRVEEGVRERMGAGGAVPVVVALDEAAMAELGGSSRSESILFAQEELLSDLAGQGFELLVRYRSFPALAGRAEERALALLEEHRLVASVGPSARFEVALAESVPHIRADQVHALGVSGAGVTVAVLDTGIDTDHPDLADDVAPGAWHSLGDGSNQGPGAEDDHGHGTHVSGIITSSGSVAPVGVAPDAQVLAVKVLDAGGNGTLIDVLAGIDYVTASAASDPTLRVLNMSLATFVRYQDCPCDAVDTLTITIGAALAAAEAAGVANIAASGNNGSCGVMPAPACLSAATAVAATFDTNDTIVDFASRNACNALAAPGVDISSSTMGGGSAAWSGTSMAAPHVSGVAALLQQHALGQCSPLTPAALVQLLLDTGLPTVDACGIAPNPRRVDALAALDALRAADEFRLYCYGDGSATLCPCANASAPLSCAGCAHSAGLGARGRPTGSSSVSADDLGFQLQDARPGQPALLFSGHSAVAGGSGILFGDGLRCAGGGVQRLGVRVPDGAGGASWGPGLASEGGWSAGLERYLQAWYRDPTGSPCGAGFNLSNGLAVVLAP